MHGGQQHEEKIVIATLLSIIILYAPASHAADTPNGAGASFP
jgi:hypothetical protein